MDHCNNSRTHEPADDDFVDLVSSERGLSIEQVENNERTLNGEQGDDMLGDAWNDLAPSFCGSSLNDILNSNRQGAGATLAGSSPVLYDNSNKFNRFNQLAVLSEDLRISKILRRLMIETNRRAAVELCKKLENAVRNQSNASYICRSFDILFDNMISVLRQCPTECLENASVILGILGYINRYDFAVYKNNLTKCYANNKSLRQYLMMALRTTISCDAVNLDLKPYSERLLALLKEYLENAEVAENFVAISETISELSKHYKQSFLRHFTDIVDIIIGWHLEIEQPAYLKRHCGKILQQFAEYFLSELDFTLGLLGQFIEDIEACGGDEILSEEVSMKSKQQTEARVGAFIGAFTSIIKAMVSRGVVLNNFNASANILQDAKRIVNNVAKQCFHIVALISEETVINLNEFYCVISSYDKSVENLCDLERVIELQLNHLSGFNENQVASFLYMVLNIVRQYRTQLPLSFVSLIMNKDNICLQEIKLSCGLKTYRLLLKTYHEILNIKNVPLLQEAYRHILKDINETICHLKNSHKSMYSMTRCELILSFYLAALSVMACQTSSIIGMYALNPSILELLITNCQAANESLWTKYPTLHQALLGVIILHSTKNYNFRQSSRLLVQHQDSPTSENFSIILKFLANIMRWYVSPGLLKWIEQLLMECKDDYAVLSEKDDFLNMCENVALFARSNPNQEISNIIGSIIRYPKMPDYILYNVYYIALGALERTDDELLTTYCEIMALLPLDICLSPDQGSQLFYEDKGRLNNLYHWHKSTTCYNTLRPKYFKTFIETLEPNSSINKEFLYQIFIEKSFVHLHREHVNEYLKMVQQNKQLRNFHLQYEAARYCVQQKLRTVLGKPQETFLAIEAIIMKYARLLAEKDRPENMQNFDNVMQMQENCHMLLGFLENLEKHIYNAAEGTAYAMLPAEKPAKTFFRVNASTCGEWFKRIRTAVNLIGLHCMEPEMVIRYSESVLQNDSALTNRGYLDRTITTMVWALFSCRESDYLIGLHTWLKTKHCKGYDWIQYVADHASGHLEKAAAGYLSVLNEENAQNLDAFMKEFIQKQFSDCIYNIHTEVRSQHSTSFTYSQNHLECMEAIYQNAIAQSCGTENEHFRNAMQQMTIWTEGKYKNNKLPKQIETFSYYEIVRALQESCLARSPFGNGNDNNITWFDAVKKCIQQGLRENIVHSYEPGSCQHLLNELILLNHVAHKMELDDNISICGNGNNISSELLKKSLCWSLIIDTKSARKHIPLLLSMASKARLENNLGYSQSLLEQFFKLKDIDKPLVEIAQELKTNQFYVDYSDLDIISGVEELIKCIHAQNTSTLEVLEVGSACCVQIIQKHSETLSPPTLPHSISNFLLTMSDWLSAHRLHNSLTHGQQFKKLQNLLPDIGLCSYSDSNKSCILPATEYAVGKLLNASTICSTEEKSGEAWFLFGNWCYRWGKKLMETSGEQTDVKEVKLTNRNIVSIQDILGDEFSDLLTNRIVELLNAHMVNAIKDDNVDDDVYVDTHNASEVLQNELKNMCNISSEQLTAIVGIWRQAQKGVYGFYEEATRAYFRYLAIQSDAVLTKNSISNAPGTEDCTFVTTTLRLLRLIVKHATGLQDVLEEGLRTTPLRPWKVIVPQLFSRLNHHEHYVRRSVSDLLCRLAVNKPQLIIFPAVVGAQQELKHSDGADSHMQLSNCFMVLLNSLSSQAPDMVLQVQMLVKELRRITLLWEESWVHSLAQLYAEYSHLYNALDAESKKSRNSDELLAKYEIFRQHLLSDFRKIVAVTEKEVETNYERNFQERFKHHIDIVLKELQKPSDSVKSSEYWQKIKQLYNTFQQRPLRGSSSTIRISDVSPVLANMRNTNIAMPGVDTYEKSGVYINAVDSTIFILPTKTKPKKLSLCGSNGQNYTYLFKGQEDLHLDERIMQFLSISNSMMSRSHNTKSTDSDSFRAHHYSVIPLGSQSGLISWVDNCTPLFGIYKKWQHREAILKQQQKERQPSKSHEQGQSPAATTSRPSELFYNKLTPLLAERNLKISDPRKQWPMTVLRSVLRELSQETPADLLSKEIWCYSTNAVEWRKSVRRYTMSLAVMSIIGYVIGLGDRHLDNILIKLGTGEIVHIDYNVCFEKGKSLRVPEKVPFRMSQNLNAALGLVGTEGPYRLACSHVLKVLRKERETLLTLLEAFVYDPLVDWTVSDDGSTNRGTSAHTAAVMITSLGLPKDSQLSPNDTFKIRKHDAELSRQTLTLKVTEVKPAWLKYRNDFEIQLKGVKEHVQNVLDVRQNILQLEHERDNYTKQLAMIRELDALGSARGSHALNTVTQRYKAYKRDWDSFEKVKQLVQQTIKDIDIVLMTYFDVLLRPNEINSIDINFPSDEMNEYDLVKHLLGNAVDKFAKHEMENSFIQTHSAVVECRDLLLFYSHVMRFYPRCKLMENHLLRYKRAFTDLIDVYEGSERCSSGVASAASVEDHSIESCNAFFEQMIMIYTELQSKVIQTQAALEQRQQQMVTINKVDALNCIDDFVHLDSPRNRQYVLIYLVRRIELAYKSFILEENKLLSGDGFFLLNRQINFLESVDKFIKYLNPTHKLDVLLLLIESLLGLRDFRNSLEDACEKIFSIFMMGDSLQSCGEVNVTECSKTCPEIGVIIEKTDTDLKNTILRLQRLQEKLSHLQEIQLNADIHNIMNNWNINISDYIKSCRNESILHIISDLKLSTIAIRSNDTNNIFDMRQIKRHINDTMLDIQSKLFNGLLSYAIELTTSSISDLITTDDAIKSNESITEVADTLCDKLYVHIEHGAIMRCDEMAVIHYSKLLEQHGRVTTCYYWLHEQHLEDVNVDYPHYIKSKQEFLGSLHNINQVLSVWKSTMVKIQADLELHRNTVKEFLSSKLLQSSSGEIQDGLLKLDDAIATANQRYEFFLSLTTRLTEYSAALLQFEISGADEPFDALIQQFNEERKKLEACEVSISVVERNLVQLLDPEDKIDQCWIENISDLLDEMIFSVQKKICDLEKDETSMENILQRDGQKLQFIVDSSIRAELRQLLKMVTKSYKQSGKGDTGTIFQDIRDIQQTMKNLQCKLNELQVQLFSGEFETVMLIQLRAKVEELCILCYDNNVRLNKLVERIIQIEDGQYYRFESPTRNENSKDVGINNSQLGEQKRNAYAVSVWKRIRMKLEGRDPDPNRRSSVTEQVDYVIAEATNEDNLASLYEGWTPWV